MFKTFPVPLPPRLEQTEIVRRVEALFAFADRLEARLQSARATAERLTPAVLAKAFRGELVPQDPSDEPASELLRRLSMAQPVGGARRARRTAPDAPA
jgi:type I restriction enzyme S subunit